MVLEDNIKGIYGDVIELSNIQNEQNDESSKIFSTEEALTTSNTRKSGILESSIRRRLLNQSSSSSGMYMKCSQDLSINKLHYEAVGLVGRQEETSVLKNCLTRVIDDEADRRKELIFIKGYSGVGKSTLAYTLEKEVTESGGIFVQGKFNLFKRDEPYSAIAAAFGEICRIIKTCGEDLVAEIGKAIIEQLEEEVDILVNLIPELNEVVTVETNSVSRATVSASSFEFETEYEKWKSAFRALTRALTSFFSVVVLVLDDCQWADVSSLEVLDLLISDIQNENPLMIVGCFRSNEVDENHILSSKINDLVRKKEKCRFNTTDIELGGLAIAQVNEVIMSMLAIDDGEKTKEFSEICYKRTHGNPFFLLEFVTMLKDEELLVYNLGLLKWIWDISKIKKRTKSTDNVVGLLNTRIRGKQSENAQLLLQYAACLGSSFDLSMLELVWEKHGVALTAGKRESVLDLVEALEKSGFIEYCRMEKYKFVHDKIQEAALALGDASKRSFQFEIGYILYHWLDEEELEESLFVVANLINQGDVKRRAKFADLNLRAALKARSLSAFDSAADYVEKGMMLLPSDRWTEHREFTLRLHVIGAQMELAQGRTDRMKTYIDEVLSQENVTIHEKLPIYMIQSYQLANVQMKYREAIQFCHRVLKDLGCKIIGHRRPRPFRALISLVLTIRRVKAAPIDTYKNPKIMTDEIQLSTMLFLSRLVYVCQFTKGTETLMIMSVTKMVEMTLLHGVSESSPPSFAMLAVFSMVVLGDTNSSAFLAEAGRMMMRQVYSKKSEALASYLYSTLLFPWTKQLQSCLEQNLRGYVCAIRCGDTDCAMWSLLNHHIVIPFHMGRPLDAVLEKCSICVSQCEVLKQYQQLSLARLYSQMILNLTGASKETFLLKGDKYDIGKFEARRKKGSKDRAIVNFVRVMLFLFFGEHESAADIAIERGCGFVRSIPGHLSGMLEVFTQGVALYAMARKTKKRIFRKCAKSRLKMIKKWMKRGNPNVRHQYCLLRAEELALDRKYEAAITFYRDAIKLSARAGWLHHAALSCERYADFLLKEVSDKQEADYQVEQAIRFYNDWGAKAVSKNLETRWRALVSGQLRALD